MPPPTDLTPSQWADYERDGFVVLRGVLSAGEVGALNARVDALMDGAVTYGDALLMQLDPSAAGGGGREADYAAAGTATAGQTVGFKGPSRAYRKIGEAHAGLEVDPLFRAVCARVYGAHAGVSVYRAMVMAKPEGALGGGSALPWHQDGGDWWGLDRDPLVFAWVALTRASAANGAVQVVRGSHRRGLLSARGHTLSDAHVAELVDAAPPGDVVTVELEAGDAFLCHNWTVHRSGVNTTAEPRRGFSANFVDARTRMCAPRLAGAGTIGNTGEAFPVLWERTVG